MSVLKRKMDNYCNLECSAGRQKPIKLSSNLNLYCTVCMNKGHNVLLVSLGDDFINGE